MRIPVLAASAALVMAAALGACSREAATQIKEGAQAIGGELKEAAGDIKNDPDVKEAGDAMEAAAKDAGDELKAVAADAGDAAKDAGAELKQGAREVGDTARKAGKEARDEVDGDPKTS